MPTYLTPGVYVEEVPSANKPIEGVGTSVAAFVGLAPGGPINTPMRISNWTQFAKIYSDPSNPDNGPFMEGGYLAHAVYGFFNNGGNLCWIVRVGSEDAASTPAQAALPAATDSSVETFRAKALEGVNGQVKVEISEEPGKPGGDGGDEKTYKVTVSSGGNEGGVRRPLPEEGPREPRHQGQRRVEADQDRGHGRLPARGAARPGGRHLHPVGPGQLGRRRQARRLRG